MPQCTECYRQFFTESALHAHCRDKADHYYCEFCERLFVHNQALQQHYQYSPAHVDDTDDNDDSNSEDDDEMALCETCNRSFVNRMSFYQHLVASPVHNWCFMCSRDFSSPYALNQHSESKAHNDRNLKCPLCPKMFKIPSSIALHIESGACHNITRHQVTRAIHSLAVVPTISLGHRLEYNMSAPRAITYYSATERAFNGTAYECYLCHRTFRTLSSLNTHLASPAHDEDEFKCPRCRRTFTLISGLVQHVESEVCGIARFQQVEDYARDLTSQFARLLRL